MMLKQKYLNKLNAISHDQITIHFELMFPDLFQNLILSKAHFPRKVISKYLP